MNAESNPNPDRHRKQRTPLEWSGAEADVLLNLLATNRPLRHVFAFFFEEAFARTARMDEVLPPEDAIRTELVSTAVSELLSLSHDPPSYVRVARRGKLLGVLVASVWTSMDGEVIKLGDAVLATAGVGEELSKNQQEALLTEIGRTPTVAHPGAVRWALEQMLHDSLNAETPG